MITETEENPLLPPGCGMFIGWLFMNIIGMTLGWAMGWKASFLAPGSVSTLMLGAVMGLVLSGMQWFILRNHLQRSGWWILITTLGCACGIWAGAALASKLGQSEIVFGLIVGAVVGTCLGLFQWIYLQNQVTSAGWWIPASIFAWASSLIYYQPGISMWGALYGTLSGIVTGVVLLWLIYRPEPD
jgi:hypothetical protein